MVLGIPPKSALENCDEEDSDCDEGSDQDTGEVDDGVVEELVHVDVAEGLDSTPDGKVDPQHSDNESCHCHDATVDSALSRSHDGCECPGHKDDQSEHDHDEGYKSHEIHYFRL